MVARKFTSVDELKHYLENMVNAALDNNVKDRVIETLEGFADIDVYQAYPAPKLYNNRRKSLMQDENYEVDSSQNMKLKITPKAEFKSFALRWDRRMHGYVPTVSQNVGDELAGLINYGGGWNGYNYEYVSEEEMENPTYTAPRPFIDDTVNDLKGGMYKAYLAEGLEGLGIKVK